MTQEAIGIEIASLIEGEELKQALMSDYFKSLIKAVMWGNFRIDWRMFTFFKKDWYKEILKNL